MIKVERSQQDQMKGRAKRRFYRKEGSATQSAAADATMSETNKRDKSGDTREKSR